MIVRGHIVLLSLFAAIVLGEGLRPFVNVLAKRMTRAAAIGVALATVVGALALMWLLPLRELIAQGVALSSSLPEMIANAVLAAKQSPQAASALAPIGERLFPQLSVALSMLGLTAILVVFWLTSSDGFGAFLLSLAPERRRAELAALFDEIGNNLSAYVLGTLVNGSMVAVECGAGLLLFGLPYAAAIAILQGLLTLIPYLGPAVGAIVAGIVVLAVDGWTKAALAIAIVSLAHIVQGSFVSPLIFKRAIDIDPLVTVVATALGGALFGIIGVLLAVPAASILQTLVIKVIAPAIREHNA